MSKSYVPERGHIVWLDYEQAKDKEIGKFRPALVLSSKLYQLATGRMICCPISTSIRGLDFEVPLQNFERPSVVVSNYISTVNWQERHAKFVQTAPENVVHETLARLIPVISDEDFMGDWVAQSLEDEV